MNQHQPMSITHGGSQEPTPIQTAAQQPTCAALPYLPDLSVQPQHLGRRMPRLRSHKALGIIQMVAGVFCINVEVTGLAVGNLYFFGTGIYTGILFFIAGLLGYLAFRKNNRRIMVACMVMNIIASYVAVIGLKFSVSELWLLLHCNESKKCLRVKHQMAKSIILIIACSFELVVTIVHAAFTCASRCPCCWSRQAVHGPAHIGNTNLGQIYQYQGNISMPMQYPPKANPDQQPLMPVQQIPMPCQPSLFIQQPPMPTQEPTTSGHQAVLQGADTQSQGHRIPCAPSFNHGCPPELGADLPPPYSSTEAKK